MLTQRPLLAWFRGERDVVDAAWHGAQNLIDAFAAGARNMIIVAVATATAGIIVGAVTLTGVALVMSELVTALTGGNIILMLALVATICLILGMGLPTTANYIVVSSLMAPVVVAIGAQNGLFVPLIAAHLFVFYFGLMADITPPVGLASYAAASIALANPFQTGIIAFRYSMRMVLLPFMFVLNPKLLLIGVSGVHPHPDHARQRDACRLRFHISESRLAAGAQHHGRTAGDAAGGVHAVPPRPVHGSADRAVPITHR